MGEYIYFVRHGQSDSNKDGVMRNEQAMLNEKGREQAALVAERIERIGVEALVSSTFQRTLDTAGLISKRIGLPLEESPLFVECRSASARIGMHRDDAKAFEIAVKIFEGFATPGFRYEDAESAEDLRTRANDALDFLAKHPKDRICVVTHGLFMRVLFCAAVHGPDFTGTALQDVIRALDQSNTAVSHFVFKQDPFINEPTYRWYIEQWNDSNHLG